MSVIDEKEPYAECELCPHRVFTLSDEHVCLDDEPVGEYTAGYAHKECARQARIDEEARQQAQAERAFEATLSGDDGGASASYRAELRAAGRGHLLGDCDS